MIEPFFYNKATLMILGHYDNIFDITILEIVDNKSNLLRQSFLKNGVALM